MAKSVLVGLAVLTLATSAALAATDETTTTTTTHHRHAAKPATAAPAAAAPATAAPASPSPVAGALPSFWGVSAADHEMYIKNQHDSGLVSGQ
jgi:hypothetical protein